MTALKYIEASDSYLSNPAHRRSMSFEGWPDIKSRCPICGHSGCATYRGYYSRFLFCTELEFLGYLVVRTGYCKFKKIRFTLLPEFVIHRRRVSVFTQNRLREARASHQTLLAAIDELNSDLGEEFYLPISTANLILTFYPPQPP